MRQNKALFEHNFYLIYLENASENLLLPERAQLIKVVIMAGQKVRDGLFKASANETSSCGIRKPNGAMNIYSLFPDH